jgi:hypothetical protein
VSGADEEDVAGLDADALRPLCCVEAVGEHVLARVEPADASDAGYVEEHPATDQAIAQQVDRAGHRPSGGDLCIGDSSIEHAVVHDMTAGVDVAVPLVVVADADVVLGEAHASGSDVDVGQHDHLVMGGSGLSMPPFVLSARPTETVTPRSNNPAAVAIRPSPSAVRSAAVLIPGQVSPSAKTSHSQDKDGWGRGTRGHPSLGGPGCPAFLRRRYLMTWKIVRFAFPGGAGGASGFQ